MSKVWICLVECLIKRRERFDLSRRPFVGPLLVDEPSLRAAVVGPVCDDAAGRCWVPGGVGISRNANKGKDVIRIGSAANDNGTNDAKGRACVVIEPADEVAAIGRAANLTRWRLRARERAGNED